MDHDVIGDVHGEAGKLEALLGALGYRREQGVHRASGRQAVFLGDLVDRGPGQLEVLAIVRPMLDAGAALAVMGNHELNAAAWHTPDPRVPGEFLRPHGGSYGEANRHQHEAFLTAVEGRPALHAELVEQARRARGVARGGAPRAVPRRPRRGRAGPVRSPLEDRHSFHALAASGLPRLLCREGRPARRLSLPRRAGAAARGAARGRMATDPRRAALRGAAFPPIAGSRRLPPCAARS